MSDKRRSVTEDLKEARQRIAELEAENARLREGAASTAAVLNMIGDFMARMKQDLERALVPTDEDDIEAANAADEQSLDYFNRYIAGDR